jgi:hypothetical protein
VSRLFSRNEPRSLYLESQALRSSSVLFKGPYKAFRFVVVLSITVSGSVACLGLSFTIAQPKIFLQYHNIRGGRVIDFHPPVQEAHEVRAWWSGSATARWAWGWWVWIISTTDRCATSDVAGLRSNFFAASTILPETQVQLLLQTSDCSKPTS